MICSGTFAVGGLKSVKTWGSFVQAISYRMPTSAKMPLQMCMMFALLQTFPDIDEMYKQRTLTRLLEKEQWAVAATYAGQDVQCQVRDVIPFA